MMKRLWDACGQCVGKHTRDTCVSASNACEWSDAKAECDCKDEDAILKDLGPRFESTLYAGCGFYSRIYAAGQTCDAEPIATCTSKKNCEESKTSYEPPENGAVGTQCVEKEVECNANETSSLEALCPGCADCINSSTKVLDHRVCADEYNRAIVPCLRGKCAIWADITDCEADPKLDKADCEDPARSCEWNVGEGRCQADILPILPDTCLLKRMATLNKPCETPEARVNKASCEEVDNCVWEEELKCDGSVSALEGKCSAEWMLAGTCDHDLHTWMKVGSIGNACEKATDQTTCEGVTWTEPANSLDCPHMVSLAHQRATIMQSILFAGPALSLIMAGL